MIIAVTSLSRPSFRGPKDHQGLPNFRLPVHANPAALFPGRLQRLPALHELHRKECPTTHEHDTEGSLREFREPDNIPMRSVQYLQAVASVTAEPRLTETRSTTQIGLPCVRVSTLMRTS